MDSVNEKSVLVSIIIPTHNCLNYLKDAVSSILLQENIFFNFEIIICDDNSSDGTWEWLKDLSQSNQQIMPIKLSGVGPATARNIAVDHASGKYLAFLDADDTWCSDKLAEQIDFHQNNTDIVMSFTDYLYIEDDGTILGTCFNFWSNFSSKFTNTPSFKKLNNSFLTIFADNIVGTSTVVVSKNAFEIANRFDESLPSAEDWDLWLKLTFIGEIGICSEVKAHYLIMHSSSTNNSETSKFEERLKALDIIYDRYKSHISYFNITTLLIVKSR